MCTDNPTITFAEKCISCGRCIYHCPQKARKHKGLNINL
ncbi:MAG: 4Fe-4S binding protein [Paramuribaculum sp.]|nr:4Fe-4S binding protein [Paramuribaculum sp.]